MMKKLLDMPEGNGICSAYERFAEQINRGRSVAVVRILEEGGVFSCYIKSGEPVSELNEANTFQHCLLLTHNTRKSAEAAGHHPVEGFTHELTKA
jgi:hypothetical protein